MDNVDIATCLRLGRFSFAAGTRSSLAYAREAVPSLRSPFPVALWFLCCYSRLYPPSYRVYVSLSSGFPGGVCALCPSFHRWLLAWSPTPTPISESRPMVSSFRQSVFRYRRLALSAGFPGGEYWSKEDLPAPSLALFGPSRSASRHLSHVGLLYVTTVQTRIRCLAIAARLVVVLRWDRSVAPFHPALEIDDQSLLQG